MSKQPEELRGWAAAIHAAFVRCTELESKLSVPKLYWQFIQERLAEGFRDQDHGRGLSAFRSWMKGDSEPNATDLVFVCRTLNGFLVAHGHEPMLADIPLPAAPGGPGDGAATDNSVSSADPDEGTGGYLSAVA